jgi:hypothetical protein
MFNEELRGLLVQVITSWQVLAVTGVLIIYIFLVNSVARVYHRRRHSYAPPKIKKGKSKETTEGPDISASDDLGLEEE